MLEAAGKAVDTYDGLAVRGRGVVDRYRGSGTPGTEDSVTVVVEQVVPKGAADRQNHEIKVESEIDEAVLAEEPSVNGSAAAAGAHTSSPHNGKPTPADAAAAARKAAPRKRPTGPKGA